jgi:hypothetical protein
MPIIISDRTIIGAALIATGWGAYVALINTLTWFSPNSNKCRENNLYQDIRAIKTAIMKGVVYGLCIGFTLPLFVIEFAHGHINIHDFLLYTGGKRKWTYSLEWQN